MKSAKAANDAVATSVRESPSNDAAAAGKDSITSSMMPASCRRASMKLSPSIALTDDAESPAVPERRSFVRTARRGSKGTVE